MVLSILITVFKFLLLSPPEVTPDDRLFYQEIFPLEICPVKHGSCSPAFPLCGHLYKGNTPRLASLPVLDNIDRHNTSSLGEKGSEFGFGGLGRKVSHVYFLIYFSLPNHFPPRLNDISIF